MWDDTLRVSVFLRAKTHYDALQSWRQHYTRLVLGTTRAEGAQAVRAGAEALAPTPIIISVDRIVVMVPDLERMRRVLSLECGDP